MERLIGKTIEVFLKTSGEVIYGILVDIEDEYVHVQSSIDVTITIPKENIKYYSSKSNQNSTNTITPQPILTSDPDPATIDSCLCVYVDQQLIAEIPVPPTFDLSSYNDNIMKVMLGNPDVGTALAGRVQRSAEYFPGKIYISTDKDGDESVAEGIPQPPNSNSFAMSGPNIVNNYLQPSQMVSRLNNVKKSTEEKKDE